MKITSQAGSKVNIELNEYNKTSYCNLSHLDLYQDFIRNFYNCYKITLSCCEELENF